MNSFGIIMYVILGMGFYRIAVNYINPKQDHTFLDYLIHTLGWPIALLLYAIGALK